MTASFVSPDNLAYMIPNSVMYEDLAVQSGAALRPNAAADIIITALREKMSMLDKKASTE